MSAPLWANQLTAQVCEAAGVKTPQLRWRTKPKSFHSTGRTTYPNIQVPNGRITVTAGYDKRDQLLVMLHELAHHLTPKSFHNADFWAMAFDLYEVYNIAEYAATREHGYKAGARAEIAARGLK